MLEALLNSRYPNNPPTVSKLRRAMKIGVMYAMMMPLERVRKAKRGSKLLISMCRTLYCHRLESVLPDELGRQVNLLCIYPQRRMYMPKMYLMHLELGET